MPRESDFEAMPRWQQIIYIISDCNENKAEPDDICQNLIHNLIESFYAEAERYPDGAFNLCYAIYRDDHTFGISDLYTLEPDEPVSVPAAPSMESYEESFWNAFSNAIYDSYRSFRAKGLTCYLPIYVFFIHQNEHLEDAINGREDLSRNNYFRIAVQEHRRLIFSRNSIWTHQCDQLYVLDETDRSAPLDVLNESVLNLVLRIPQRQLQTGEDRWFFKQMENEIVLGLGVYPEGAALPNMDTSIESIVPIDEAVFSEDTETVSDGDD